MAPRIPGEESLDDMLRQLSPKSKPPARVKRFWRGLTRVLIIFGIGVVTTLAWQSYGHEARKMISNASPQLGWLAPLAAPNDTASAETMRRSLDQLASNQQQMAGDIAKLLMEQKQLLQKISAPLPPAVSHASNMPSSSTR